MQADRLTLSDARILKEATTCSAVSVSAVSTRTICSVMKDEAGLFNLSLLKEQRQRITSPYVKLIFVLMSPAFFQSRDSEMAFESSFGSFSLAMAGTKWETAWKLDALIPQQCLFTTYSLQVKYSYFYHLLLKLNFSEHISSTSNKPTALAY